MHLVAALAAGVRGAEEGWAEFLARGTSNRAAYYADFEATTADSSGRLELDSNGAGIAYVNQLTDVVVYSSGGVEVRRFVAGANASGVEVISQSFTGSDYETAISAASKPTSLQAVLDLWKDSAGTLDWKVLVGGASKTLQDALAGLASIIRSVKAPEYGAEGDGATDDWSAITNCLQDGPGIVFFPPGDYRFGSTITVPQGVILWGAGSDCTSLSSSDNGQTAISFEAATVAWNGMQGLTISQTETVLLGVVEVKVGAQVIIRDCRIAGTDLASFPLITSAGKLMLERSTLVLSGASTGASIYVSKSADSRLWMDSCEVYTSPGSYAPGSGMFFIGQGEQISNLLFRLQGSGTFTVFKLGANSEHRATITDCNVDDFDSSTITMFDLGTLGINHRFYEDGNAGKPLAPRLYTFTDGNLSLDGYVHLGSRRGQRNETVPTVDPHEVSAVRDHEFVLITYSDAGAMGLWAPPMPAGARLTIMLRNDTGGASGAVDLNITSSKGFLDNRAAAAIASATRESAQFISQYDAAYGGHVWVQVGAWSGAIV